MPNKLTVVVLAAGGGTRMKSKTMKVLHPIGGRSLIGHVLAAVNDADPDEVVTVVGAQREQVGPHVQSLLPDVRLAVQEEQRGTGDAVRAAVDALVDLAAQQGASDGPAGRAGERPLEGTVLVMTGDTPLLTGQSLRAFADDHEAAQRAVSILSARNPQPGGYGRVVRAADGEVEGIVEEKDATAEQRAIEEVSSGILAFEASFLQQALPRIGNDNQSGEYYLTDTVGLAREAGLMVGAYTLDDLQQTAGANDRVQLAALGREHNDRLLREWMRAGVTVVDPQSTWVDADVTLAPDVTLLPGTQLLGATVVAEDAVVGPDSTLKDCEVGEGASVVRTHAELAVVGDHATVGPFAHLRPGTQLGSGGKIGGFCETKNAVLGDEAKVPHLTYVGDADIGEGANIGAGTVFANYDGVAKHRTSIGAYAHTASNTTFVAPVTVGDGAGTGAGAVVREDVPPGALAVTAGPQRTIEGWVFSRRAGTPQADAARAAGAAAPDVTESAAPASGAPGERNEEHSP